MKPLTTVSPIRSRIVLATIFLVFAGLYCCISVVNHLLFRTHTGDYAYYSHAIYQFSQFRLGEYMVTTGPYWHTFGDHFEPILLLVAPLRYLFGQWTVIVIQIGGILFGAWGLFRYVRYRTGRAWLPHLAAAYFCSFWGIYSALAFDFHASVLAAMLVPWFFDAFERDRFRHALIWYVLFLMCAEKAAIWGMFIGLGAALMYRRDRRKWPVALLGSVLAFGWLMLAVKVIIPYFLKEGEVYRHFRLKHWGETTGEAFVYLATHPLEALSAFFFNHLPDYPRGDHLKLESYKMILLSGGLILLWRPQFLLMLFPIFVGKMLNDLSVNWGINIHHSIEFVPIIALAVMGWLVKLKSARLQYGILGFLVVLTLTSTFVSWSTRYEPHYRRSHSDVFWEGHWKRERYDPADIYEAMEYIPDEVSVSATECILPHVVMRDTAYRYPKYNDAAYVIICLKGDTYPADREEIEWRTEVLIEKKKYVEIFRNESAVVYRRPGVPPTN